MNNTSRLIQYKKLSHRYPVASVKGLIGIFAMSYLLTCHAQAVWLDSTWTCRQQVSISGNLAATETLTNFPVLVQITDQANPIFSKSKNNGQDIAFTAADGITRLAHEIDSYKAGAIGSRTLNAWVSIPELLAGEPTVIYMYYGNQWSVDEQDSATVWAAYAGVWHLEEEQAGLNTALELYKDSTTNGYDGRDYVATNSAAGRVGKGAGMGGEDYIKFRKTLSTTNDFTITAWTKPDRLDWEPIVGNEDSRYFMLHTASQLIGRSSISATSPIVDHNYGTGANLEIGVWQHVAFRSTGEDGSSRTFYKNGAQLASTVKPLSVPLPSDNWATIGRWHTDKFFHGVLDEVRISDKALPPAWLAAEYRNASAPAAYLTFETEDELAVTAAPWLSRTFSYRQEIGFDRGLTQAALTNFPMLIAITNSANPLFSVAAANGSDIVFTDIDGVTILPHEIEEYHASPASLHAWVRLPTLHATKPTRLFMYYGRSYAIDHLNPTNVWSEDYLGVWHLGESVSNGETNKDSTANVKHGVFKDPNNRGGGNAVGKIAGANTFAGNDDHYVLTPGVTCPTNGFTLSAWVNDADTSKFMIYESGDGSYSYSGINGLKHPIYSILLSADRQQLLVDNDIIILKDAWYYYTLVSGPTNMKMYIDGELTEEMAYAVLKKALRAKYIGRNNGAGNSFKGTVDELRVSSALRSAEWIKACYNTQKAPGKTLICMPSEYRSPEGAMLIVR